MTLRVAGLTVPGCKGTSAVVRNTTYAVLSRNQFCRELRAHGGGGSQKVTSDDEGEGGVRIPPKNDDVIYEQPLKINLKQQNPCIRFQSSSTVILLCLKLLKYELGEQ